MKESMGFNNDGGHALQQCEISQRGHFHRGKALMMEMVRAPPISQILRHLESIKTIHGKIIKRVTLRTNAKRRCDEIGWSAQCALYPPLHYTYLYNLHLHVIDDARLFYRHGKRLSTSDEEHAMSIYIHLVDFFDSWRRLFDHFHRRR